ncbi:MAG: hypothetical protein Q8P15_01705, partial [Nanoarchaeota archaeon]|nr:hypothetical protein [Nanoarchaeota archaeon]
YLNYNVNMTVCSGPSIESMIFTLIIAVIVPSLIIYLIHKKWKSKSKLLFVFSAVVIFIILFLGISIFLFQIFTPHCGAEIYCIPFKFYSENNTCEYGNEIINDINRCNQLQKKYLSQLESGEKSCLRFEESSGKNFIMETG